VAALQGEATVNQFAIPAQGAFRKRAATVFLWHCPDAITQFLRKQKSRIQPMTNCWVFIGFQLALE